MPGYTLAAEPVEPPAIEIMADHPDRVAGVTYGADTVVARLREVGCTVRRGGGPDGAGGGGGPDGQPGLTRAASG